MRRSCAAFLAVAALLLSTVMAFAQEPTKIYGLTIPDQVGGLVHGQPVDYESKNPGLGYSLRFSGRPGWIVDVYLYDLGLKSIPDDAGSDVVRKQLAMAKGDVFELGRRGLYADVTDQGDFNLADGGQVSSVCTAFSYLRGERKDINVDSFLCVKPWNNKFVKIRMTAPKGMMSKDDATGFVRAWISLLNK